MKVVAKITTSELRYENLEIEEKIEKNNIKIDTNVKYQTHKGFGGALTESSAYVYSLLSSEQKEEFINAVFGKDGLNYNMARLTIGSCDFSLASYDYIIDQNLDTFNLEHEKKYLFPLLFRILKMRDMTFMASSWTPLAFMKDNNDKCHGGHLKEEFYDEYAEYLVTYIKKMRELNVNITSMTIQNEPEAVQVWESCLFDEKSEAKLAKCIKNHLNEKELNNIKLFIWDHNRDVIKRRIANTLKYLNESDFDGVAYHWYDNWAFSQLTEIHKMLPHKDIFFTEGCVELLINNNQSGAFSNGMRYAKNFILDCLNYTNGFFDWNILLDSNGGPNHVGNYCEAPIMYDIKHKKLIYNYSYLMIKHFSNFVLPNARRIHISQIKGINTVAYENEDGTIAIIIVNDYQNMPISFEIDNQHISCYSRKDSVISIMLGM